MSAITTESAVQRICLALDFSEPDRAVNFARKVRGHVGLVKIGLELFTAGGEHVVKTLRDEGFGIFLDLKFHDIPNTVAGAVRVVSKLGVRMLTIHASGGADMLTAAVSAAAEGADNAGCEPPKVIGITVLTSLNEANLRETFGIEAGVDATAERLALLASRAGLAGVVASPLEIGRIRSACGSDLLIITPGIRLDEGEHHDQKRTLGPGAAVKAGASLLVVGRPIRQASDPVEAALRIIRDIKSQ